MARNGILCLILLVFTINAQYYSLNKNLEIAKIPVELAELLLKDTDILATATFIDDRNISGWTYFTAQTNNAAEDWLQLYSAGYLEGYLASEQIWDTWVNAQTKFSPIPAATWEYVANQTQWVQASIEQYSTDNYWGLVNSTFSQFLGIYHGYLYAIQEQNQTAYNLSFANFTAINYMEELGDITYKVTNGALDIHEPHCSFLLKDTEDGLVLSHTTWTRYTAFLKTYKIFTFNLNNPIVNTKKMSLSGFPGIVPSIDDFYVLDDNRVVTETTLVTKNMSLYSALHYESLPYWIRVQVANLAYTTQQSWADLYFSNRSATYNNQWLVVDFNNYEASKNNLSNATDIIWMIEEFYTLTSSQDVTQQLLVSQGYVASYNIPYNETLQEAGQNPTSYVNDTRAILFAKYAPGVQNIQDFQAVMRLNNFNDTGNYCKAIAARCDLEVNGSSLFGAIDCKVTSNTLAANHEALIIIGPTYENLPYFSWANWPQNSVDGLPTVYNFDWLLYDPATNFSAYSFIGNAIEEVVELVDDAMVYVD